MRSLSHSPIIITLPEIYPNEPEALLALVRSGAGIIHLRKPDSTEDELKRWLTKVDPEVRSHLTIHYHTAWAERFNPGGVHLKADQIERFPKTFRKSVSCHQWAEVKALTGQADYVFLSPVFNSISKEGYQSAFTANELHDLLKDTNRPPVVALGGIAVDNIACVRAWGFDGAAAIGSVWNVNGNKIDIEKSVSNYLKLKETWNKTK